MPELPVLSHCSSTRLYKIKFSHTYTLIREIYESGSITALVVTSNFDCVECCRCVHTIPYAGVYILIVIW